MISELVKNRSDQAIKDVVQPNKLSLIIGDPFQVTLDFFQLKFSVLTV
jgi:hypothetical protein